jgi:hypothetical protein
MKTSHTLHPTLAPVQALLTQLEKILLRIDRRLPEASDRVGDATQALETLPLATDEFAVARNRLQNAAGYLRQDEWGAARYEVNLVLGWLRTSINRFVSVAEIA